MLSYIRMDTKFEYMMTLNGELKNPERLDL